MIRRYERFFQKVKSEVHNLLLVKELSGQKTIESTVNQDKFKELRISFARTKQVFEQVKVGGKDLEVVKGTVIRCNHLKCLIVERTYK